MDIQISETGKPSVQCAACGQLEEATYTLVVVMHWIVRKREWKTWSVHRRCKDEWLPRAMGVSHENGAEVIEFSEFLLRMIRQEAVVLTLDDDTV